MFQNRAHRALPAHRLRRLALLLIAAFLLVSALVLQSRPSLLHVFRFASPPDVLSVPVEGVRRSDLRSTWGAPRSEGRRHKGADIFSPRGTTVRSATRGIVWKVGTDRLGGKVVTVLGEGPAFYYYAHLEEWAEGLARGQEVQAGQTLGTVGNSGNARRTPPHLHFGVYRIGWTGIRAVDPVPLLQRELDP